MEVDNNIIEINKQQAYQETKQKEAKEQLYEYAKKVEAVLYTTGNFMNIEDIARLCGIYSEEIILEAISILSRKYKEEYSALEIQEEGEKKKFKLGIKKEFNYLTTQLLKDTEFDRQTIETLALIAYMQPVLQSNIVKMRGNWAYQHIRLLEEKELITSQKKGRTRMIKLTQRFFDYFDIVEPNLKEKLDSLKNKPDINKGKENKSNSKDKISTKEEILDIIQDLSGAVHNHEKRT